MTDQPKPNNSQYASSTSMVEHPPDQTNKVNATRQLEEIEEFKEIDQSNEHVSIGNRTAEELVGDILASDPLDNDDLDVMISSRIAGKEAESSHPIQNYVKKVIDSEDDNQNLDCNLMLRQGTNEEEKSNPA